MLSSQVVFNFVIKHVNAHIKCFSRHASGLSVLDGSLSDTAETSRNHVDIQGSTDLPKLSFREMQTFRRNQAHQSVLIQASSLESAGAVQHECEKCGHVKAMFHYRQMEKVGNSMLIANSSA